MVKQVVDWDLKLIYMYNDAIDNNINIKEVLKKKGSFITTNSIETPRYINRCKRCGREEFYINNLAEHDWAKKELIKTKTLTQVYFKDNCVMCK